MGGRGRTLEVPGQRLRRFGGLGWREVSPWVWSHPAVGRRLCLDPAKAGWEPDLQCQAHHLRESWRRGLWASFLDSKRHEAPELRHIVYHPGRAKSVRELAKSASVHEVAVLTGGANPHRENIQPYDALHARFGWPGHTQTISEARKCLAFLAEVRRDMLSGHHAPASTF